MIVTINLNLNLLKLVRVFNYSDDKVIVENYDVHLKIDKFEVINIKIQIKELNYKGKKIGGLDIVFQVDNTGGRLLNESGRNFINRLRKA
jgi:hypothetical protein